MRDGARRPVRAGVRQDQRAERALSRRCSGRASSSRSWSCSTSIGPWSASSPSSCCSPRHPPCSPTWRVRSLSCACAHEAGRPARIGRPRGSASWGVPGPSIRSAQSPARGRKRCSGVSCCSWPASRCTSRSAGGRPRRRAEALRYLVTLGGPPLRRLSSLVPRPCSLLPVDAGRRRAEQPLRGNDADDGEAARGGGAQERDVGEGADGERPPRPERAPVRDLDRVPRLPLLRWPPRRAPSRLPPRAARTRACRRGRPRETPGPPGARPPASGSFTTRLESRAMSPVNGATPVPGTIDAFLTMTV